MSVLYFIEAPTPFSETGGVGAPHREEFLLKNVLNDLDDQGSLAFLLPPTGYPPAHHPKSSLLGFLFLNSTF